MEAPVRFELIDINEILKTLPHRFPMLLIDRVINIRADYSGIGIKNVTFNEIPFLGHFPERPVYPGVMMIEAMAQTAGVIGILSVEGTQKPRAVYVSPSTDPFPPLAEIQAETGRAVEALAQQGVSAWLMTRGFIRPAALRGPSLTIRKFRDFVMDIDDLLREGSLSPAMADFLRACVLGRMNILVSGGTGSGKTTSLNVMASYIPENQRVVTIGFS